MAHPILESQDALKTLLAARGAWAGVDIRDGGPTEGEDIHPTAFWFNGVTSIVGDWAQMAAPNRRRLNYTIGFSIMARVLGDDERATRQVVLDLFDDLELCVKANPALGIPAHRPNDRGGVRCVGVRAGRAGRVGRHLHRINRVLIPCLLDRASKHP